MQSSGNPGKKSQCSSVARQERVAPRGATTCINGGANCLYSITTRQEQENSINVVTSMIKIFIFYVFALLNPGQFFL